MNQQNKRNVAVIAHVDHGKTTLVDALLKQTHTFRANQEEMAQEQILDSGDLERERGITILAKNCAVVYKDTKINIIDTPGHADFSGEVERTLGMADGALLIVDAQEGPMPQTRFVLRRALELGLKIIVVINKIDKRFARPAEAISRVESLFLELAKDESQLDFPVIYAIGRRGVAFKDLPQDTKQKGDITPLLDLILSHIPAPKNSTKGLFQMVVTSLDYESHLGQIAIGKIFRGKLEKGQKVVIASSPEKLFKIEKIMVPEGLIRVEVDEAEAGDIVAIAGVNSLKIGQTICDPADTTPLPEIAVSPPTLHITIGPNTSPFAGQEGEFSTGKEIEERLKKEIETNLSLKVEALGNGKFEVSGRGELHLAILLETLRREGYEMEVGKPEVILKKMDGELKEPVEEVNIIVPQEFIGVINQEMGKRYAKLVKMEAISESGETEFIYQIPTRALIGLRSLLLTLTKGTIILSSQVIAYEKAGRELPKLRRGALISQSSGMALAYGLETAQNRGITFIDPGETVYEGMIVGQNAKDEDIEINVCKGKKLTNMRSKSSDGIIQLTPATKLSLEKSLDFLERDELLEITPKNLRLRKKHLTQLARRRVSRSLRSSQNSSANL